MYLPYTSSLWPSSIRAKEQMKQLLMWDIFVPSPYILTLILVRSSSLDIYRKNYFTWGLSYSRLCFSAHPHISFCITDVDVILLYYILMILHLLTQLRISFSRSTWKGSSAPGAAPGVLFTSTGSPSPLQSFEPDELGELTCLFGKVHGTLPAIWRTSPWCTRWTWPVPFLPERASCMAPACYLQNNNNDYYYINTLLIVF